MCLGISGCIDQLLASSCASHWGSETQHPSAADTSAATLTANNNLYVSHVKRIGSQSRSLADCPPLSARRRHPAKVDSGGTLMFITHICKRSLRLETRVGVVERDISTMCPAGQTAAASEGGVRPVVATRACTCKISSSSSSSSSSSRHRAARMLALRRCAHIPEAPAGAWLLQR